MTASRRALEFTGNGVYSLATAIDVSDDSYQKELERSYFSLFLRSANCKFLEISIFTSFSEVVWYAFLYK